jgi:hypothetical protein
LNGTITQRLYYIKRDKGTYMSGKKTRDIDTTIDVELNRKFRDIVYKKYGFKRGAISAAVEEAIRDYVNKYSDGMQKPLS